MCSVVAVVGVVVLLMVLVAVCVKSRLNATGQQSKTPLPANNQGFGWSSFWTL
jgi:hypothetical protein